MTPSTWAYLLAVACFGANSVLLISYAGRRRRERNLTLDRRYSRDELLQEVKQLRYELDKAHTVLDFDLKTRQYVPRAPATPDYGTPPTRPEPPSGVEDAPIRRATMPLAAGHIIKGGIFAGHICFCGNTVEVHTAENRVGITATAYPEEEPRMTYAEYMKDHPNVAVGPELTDEPDDSNDPRWAYPELSVEQTYTGWPCAECRTRRDEHASDPAPSSFPELDITDHDFVPAVDKADQ